jgi:hypothetical protein
MTAYRAPGLLAELDAPLLAAWNTELRRQFGIGVNTALSEAPAGINRPWFYDGVAEPAAPAAEPAVTWTAFPRTLTLEHGTAGAARLAAESDRNTHDEYCEWAVVRNPQGDVLRVVFTTETPDYFRFLAANRPALLLGLYREFVSSDVELADLMVGTRYNPDNQWNFPPQPANDGFLMHMRVGANNLLAAVQLAAQASWPRAGAGGQAITQEQPLIQCAAFGVDTRHSDPHIGAQVNALVRAGSRVTLADPAALYIDNVDLSGWERPDGGDPAELMTIERGTPEFILRLSFEAPAGAGFDLGDVTIDGARLRFGGQIAELMEIRLQAATLPKPGAPAIGCVGGLGGPTPPIAMDEPEAGAALSRSGAPLD